MNCRVFDRDVAFAAHPNDPTLFVATFGPFVIGTWICVENLWRAVVGLMSDEDRTVISDVRSAVRRDAIESALKRAVETLRLRAVAAEREVELIDVHALNVRSRAREAESLARWAGSLVSE